jgi:prevent-host-death family protein
MREVGFMRSVNVHDAKTHLSRLLEEVARGNVITIAKAGRPIARLIPIGHGGTKRTPGFLRGRIVIAPDFDAPLPEDVERRFYEEPGRDDG